MIIRNVELETVCGVTSTLPENTLPEFAFAGKSNVGKSSLINALMNRKALARTSSQPGKTQTINFYNINGDLYYVDLPGYGYAKVPQSEKVKWGRMIENYLHKSQMLKCVFLLVDIRHEPSANDKTMYDWVVYNGFRPVIIATKLDKIKRSQIQKQVKLIRTGLGMEKQDILIPVLRRDKTGKRGRLEPHRQDGSRRRSSDCRGGDPGGESCGMGGEEGGERGAAEPLNFGSTEKRHPPQKFPCGRCRFRVQFRKFAGGRLQNAYLNLSSRSSSHKRRYPDSAPSSGWP